MQNSGATGENWAGALTHPLLFKVGADENIVPRLLELENSHVLAETERIEFVYAYGPDLLPAPVPSNDGMWRYHKLLPLSGTVHYPLAVGGTPLIASPGVRAWTGAASLWLKDETRSPTGSNKDRATALILEHALYRQAQTVCCASTGNVAISLAFGAAATGLKAVIFVPAHISEAKLRLMMYAGAIIFKVKEGYEAAVSISRLAARTFGWYDRNTGYNSLTVEAKKTVALEIWEQLARQRPDVVVVPVGDGVTLNGIAKGFRELVACGAIDRSPRIIGIQAEGCQPLTLAWEKNAAIQQVPATTIADGIAVSWPINGYMALRDVRASGGCFLSVSDEALLAAVHALATRGGILAEPAGAAACAGVRAALEQGLIQPDERVVALVTGTGLKTPQYLQPHTTAVYEVSAHLDDIKNALLQLSRHEPGTSRVASEH